MDRKAITLRLTEEQDEALKKEAEEKGLSVHELIITKLFPIDTSFLEGLEFPTE